MERLFTYGEIAEKKLLLIEHVARGEYDKANGLLQLLVKDSFNKDYVNGRYPPLTPEEENIIINGKIVDAVVKYKARTGIGLMQSKWIADAARDTFAEAKRKARVLESDRDYQARLVEALPQGWTSTAEDLSEPCPGVYLDLVGARLNIPRRTVVGAQKTDAATPVAKDDQ